MNFATSNRRRARGFTLAEVLAALAFMAIVIPVAVEGLRVASRAGLVGERKAIAARVANRVLNEWMVEGGRGVIGTRGAAEEGLDRYAWDIRLEGWPEGTMRLVTVRVLYQVQGEEYEFELSTLVDPASL
jgi:prepilin-type N-terminal cleavage/methylation domain-containing protein